MLPSTLHHVTYAHVKFVVATSNGLGGGGEMQLPENILYDLDLGQGHTKSTPVPSASCDLSTCMV